MDIYHVAGIGRPAFRFQKVQDFYRPSFSMLDPVPDHPSVLGQIRGADFGFARIVNLGLGTPA